MSEVETKTNGASPTAETQAAPPEQEVTWSQADWITWQVQWEALFKQTLKMPNTRQRSIARTKLEECYMWTENWHALIDHQTKLQAQAEETAAAKVKN